MGLTPNPDGLLPDPDVKRLQEWGNEIRSKCGVSLASVSGKGRTIDLKLNRKREINQVIIQEDIAKGERIRKYTVLAFVGGKWKVICDGQSVGHKRIQQFNPVECSRVRLLINEAVAEPLVKSFSVFRN
jgi:alpha-L-fucosidase